MMAKKLSELSIEAVNTYVIRAYEVKLTQTGEDYDSSSYSSCTYADFSKIIIGTTVTLQRLLDEYSSNPRLTQYVKKELESLEEKLEKVALQNILNEKLINEGTFCYENLQDRRSLKDMILNKLK